MSDMYKQYGVVSDTVPTRFDLFTVTWNTLLVLALNLLSILYPVYYVRSFTPVEAMRHV
jgi:ABC-type lipoprotein release transport system permease subunit